MIETAVCHDQCPNCQQPMEQEGYMIVEAEDEGPVQQLLDGDVNIVHCPECNEPSRVKIPLIYHDRDQQLLIIYVPDLSQMTPEELNDNIRYPYGLLATREAARLGIDLPEPDEAAFPRDEPDAVTQPGARFHALTQEQAAELFPEYLLRPTVVDNFEVLRTAAQAAIDGMTGQEVVDDMARLQLINQIIITEEPVTRRKLLHHNEPYLNAELYEVFDTLCEQMSAEGQPQLVERLKWAKQQVERYKAAQLKRLQAKKK